MKAPGLKVRVLGHPLACWTAIGLLGLSGYGWWIAHESWPLVVGAAMIVAKTQADHDKVAAYQLWQREWASMSDAPARRSVPRWLSLAVYGGIPAVLAAYGAGVLDASAAIGIGLVAGAIAAIAWAWRAIRRGLRRGSPKARRDAVAVAVIVTRPVMGVPTLEDAYRALPGHCWEVLNNGR